MKNYSNKLSGATYKYFLAIVIIVLGFEIFLLANYTNGNTNIQNVDYAKYASEIVDKCSSEAHKASCYDNQIPKVMTQGVSMENAFLVTKEVQKLDPSYAYCHVLGHKLSAEETKKDPDSWKDVITRCPSGMCSNGCIHGAFQERFRAESLPPDQIELLKPEISDVCEARGSFNPTGLEKGTCYHALGHLTMYITNADVMASINLCDELSNKPTGDYRHVCYDGVFMQIYQPLEPDDFALIEGKEVRKDQIKDFCSKYDGQKKGSCWTEGWPLFYPDIIENPKTLTEFCSYLKSDPYEYDRCYLSVTYVMTAQKNFDEKFIEGYCNGLTGKYVSECFGHAASRMIETDWGYIDKAVHLCNQAENIGSGEMCWSELMFYSTYNFHKGSSQHLEVCGKLPERYKMECLSN